MTLPTDGDIGRSSGSTVGSTYESLDLLRSQGTITSKTSDSIGRFISNITSNSSTTYDTTRKNSDGYWYSYIGIE